MTLSQIAYEQGSRDAQYKFAAVPGVAGGPAIPAAGGLNAVPPIGTTVPGATAATLKPAAPNQALPTNPVLGTGVPGTPTIAGMGKPVSAGAAISSPAPASPATPTTSKVGSVYSPSKPPKPAKIPVQRSTVGSNNTLETVKSMPAATASSTGSTGTASGTSTSPGGTGTTATASGGIVSSTGVPAANLANETASNCRNQTVAAAGAGK